MDKRAICIGLLCAIAIFEPAGPAFAAPVVAPAASPVPISSEVEALRKQIEALKAQREQKGANIPEIDARLAQLQARLAQLVSPKPQIAGPALEHGGVATKTTISNEQIQSSNAQNTYEAIKEVPGVTQADAKVGGGADNLQVRGIHLASNTGYRLDGGLAMVNNIILPTEDKAQVQVLKGAGALEYGIASPAGIINYVLKRATKAPITSAGLSMDAFGQTMGVVDVGREFGSGNQFGTRLILAGGETGSYTEGAGGTRWLGSLTADWRSKKANTQFDFERFGINVVEQAALLQDKAGANGRVTLPPVPSPYELRSGLWARSVAVGQNISMRANYQFNDGVSLDGEVGRSDADRPHRDVSQIGNYNVVTGKGTETVTLIRDEAYINTYENLEARFRTTHGGFIENLLTTGFTRNERLFNGPVTTQVTYKQNIYNPTILPAPQEPTAPVQFMPQNSVDNDYFFTDSLILDKRFRITTGLRQINYAADDAVANGKTNQSTTSFWAPAVGAILDIGRHLALYGSYVKSLDETGQAPINAKNAFAVLPPAPATQKEVGIRARVGGIAASLGYFTIDRANATTDPITQIYGLNGRNFFQGLESTLKADLGRHVSVYAGGQVMNATEHSPDDPTINGKIPENVPKLSGAVTLGYRPAFIPGLQLLGDLQFVGERQINPQDQGTIPSVTTSSVGTSYTTLIGGRRAVINLSVKNLANKLYYSSAVNGALGISAPRNVSLSVRLAAAP